MSTGITKSCVLLFVLVAASCQGLAGEGADRGRVEAEVLATLRAFEAAEKALDPEALIAFLDPEFTMLSDGQRVDYEGTVQMMLATLPTLQSFEPRFSDVEVLVLGADAAVTSMRFDDAITGSDGVTIRMWGPSTLVWRWRDGAWRIVFGDSDHYAPADDSR